MKRLSIKILVIAISFFALASCVEQIVPIDNSINGSTLVDFAFGQEGEIIVETKAEQSFENENMISDIFVLVFDASGNKVYSKYFNNKNKKNDKSAFDSDWGNEVWYVDNSSTKGTKTKGAFRINCPTANGLKVFCITNLDSDRTYVSSELIDRNINSIADLNNYKLYLFVDSTERGYKFTSTGSLDGVNITSGGGSYSTTPETTLQLTRVDAKVKFTFQAGKRPDKNGQVIKEFRPEKWKVVNIPRYSYLVERTSPMTDASAPAAILTDDQYADYAADFFDTDWRVFEDYDTKEKASFTFYMLENRLPSKAAAPTYQDRSRQLKTSNKHNQYTNVVYTDTDGQTVSKSIRNFQYANDFSTYILVKGTVDMDLTNDDAGQVLGAQVTYLIHLGGDWTSNISTDTGKVGDSKDTYSGNIQDFTTERNHYYDYKVTINSVSNIRVEVETSDGVSTFEENQPGAWGDVTIAKEEIAVCDAHYVSQTLSFHSSHFVKEGISTADNLTWSVSTPFSEVIYVDEETTPLSTIDYKWVRFRLNKKDGSGHYFENERRKFTPRQFAHSDTWRDENMNHEDDSSTDPRGLAGYHNDGTMDVVQLVAYIKQQSELFADWVRKGKPAGENKSDFDTDTDPKICVTVFVDEFYYERNPLSGVESNTLWKRFINTSDRYLHLLSNSETSYDGDSRATGSVVSIEQKSIQSIYNIDESNAGLTKAWGLEHIDEHPEIWFWAEQFSQDDKDKKIVKQITGYDNHGSDSNDNGYLNNVKLLDLYTGSSFNTGVVRWDKFMDFEVINEIPLLRESSRYLKNACLIRNRDNNGNGVIDQEEIRWYTASINQLVNLYMGENCISMSSRLYNRDPEVKKNSSYNSSNGTNIWMQHVVSSTASGSGSDASPTIVWAEEGISTGPYTGGHQGANVTMSVRCVRNLGMSEEESLTKVADPIVKVSKNGDTWNYDMSNLMPTSKRDYISEELPFHFETDPAALVYNKFEAYNTDTTITTMTFDSFTTNLNNKIRNGEGGYCPSGYRTPNQRELAIMRYFEYGGKNVFMETGTTEYNKDGNRNDERTGANYTFRLSRTAWSMGLLQTDTKLKRWRDSDSKKKYGFSLYTTGVLTVSNGNCTRLRCVRDVRD